MINTQGKNEINIFSKRTNKFHVVLHVLQVKTQLKNSFVAYLNLIGCLFDRCIKPNWYQSPDRFDPDAVLAQVRSLAVVPTVQMRNLGFPVWKPFNVFIERSCLHFSRKITVCPQSIRSYILVNPIHSTSNKPEGRIVSVKCKRLGVIIPTKPPPLPNP